MKPQFPPGFSQGYMVELLFTEQPKVNKRELFTALQRRCPGAQPLDGSLDGGLCAFAHMDHMVQLKDARLPAQTVVIETEKPVAISRYETALQQSWGFPTAREVVAKCRANMIVTELMALALPYRERIDLFQCSVAAALEAVPCAAVYWWPTEQIIDPKRYLYFFDDPSHARFFLGALNVRLFNIEGNAGDIVMDTLGLAALGLPDLQCHFHDLDCNAIAGLLHNLGLYVFENGDVIEDGHTVEGISSGDKWRCQHEMALVGPERMVLDIDPGTPYAAGQRK
jgi:hypothetical protein